MFNKKIGILPVLILSLSMLSWAQPQEQQGKALSLSLEESIIKALKNNIGVAIQVLGPEMADISVSKAKEKFMPSLSLDYTRRSTDSASYSWLEASENVITDYNSYVGQITQLIPIGGSLSVSLEGTKTNTNSRAQLVNPRFGSTLRFNFTQPILRDFGFKMSRKEIIIAQNNLDISEKDLQKTLMDTIYNVEQAYWNLVYSIENLKVMRQSLTLAQDLLAKNQRAVEVGTMAPIDILSAQAEVATREADILNAEAMVKNNEDQLKTLLNITSEEEKAYAQILPLDSPSFVEREVNLDQSLMTAMQKRPDLEATRLDMKNQEINLSYAKNQLLPNLSLVAQYWSPGLSGDRIVYSNNDPIKGIILEKIPGGPSGAMKDALKFKYKNWSVALSLDIALSDFLSRAGYAQAKVSMDQALFRLKNQEQQIFLEIKNAVRSVQTGYKRVQAYKVARELAEKKLLAEEEKLKVGLSTNYFVLTYQRELANAKSAELKAIIDYNLSLGSLDRAMGTSLENWNIKFSEFVRRY